MEMFSSIKGQVQAKDILGAAVLSNRLAHAYIFAGPVGSGRLTAALDLAKARICPEVEPGYCGYCRQCRLIDSLNHPDVRITIPQLKTTGDKEIADLFTARAENGVTPLRLPGNTFVSIGQVRDMWHRLSRKSYEGYGAVEIVYDAHLFRREAANAMLKMLEEPPDGTLIILITSRLSGILPTIRSRSHTVRFGRLVNSLVEEVLTERTELSSEEISRLVLRSDGSPGAALLMAQEGFSDLDEAEKIIAMIFSGETGVMQLVTAVDAVSKKLGRDGTGSLCLEITNLLHDARRVRAGLEPLTCFSPPQTGDADDGVLRQMEKLFWLCVQRTRANVSPQMALSAAVAASRALYRK